MKKNKIGIWGKIVTFIADIKISNKILNFPFISWKPHMYKFEDGYEMDHEYSDFVEMIVTGEIEPGDIILISNDGYIGTYSIPGEFSHAALYIGKNNFGKYQIIHAIGLGVINESVFKVARTDKLIVIRPKNLKKYEIRRAINKAKKYKGEDYDFFFNFTNDHRMCCTELIYNAYKEYKEKFNLKLVPRFILNRFKVVPTIMADDIINSDVKLIFSNKEARETEIIKKRFNLK